MSMRVDVLDIRITWAFGTSQVLAVLALGSLALEDRLALMACPAHTLRWGSSCHFFPSRTMHHGESIRLLV